MSVIDRADNVLAETSRASEQYGQTHFCLAPIEGLRSDVVVMWSLLPSRVVPEILGADQYKGDFSSRDEFVHQKNLKGADVSVPRAAFHVERHVLRHDIQIRYPDITPPPLQTNNPNVLLKLISKYDISKSHSPIRCPDITPPASNKQPTYTLEHYLPIRYLEITSLPLLVSQQNLPTVGFR